jgi:PASTA domain
VRAALVAVVTLGHLSSAGAGELGSSGPSFGRARAYAMGHAAAAVAVGDLTGDAKPDLVSANGSRTHTVSVLDDLNGDRRRDLVVMNSSTVSVLLNKPGLCNVPELRRMTLRSAKQTLARVNCRVGKVTFDYSRTIKGPVIRQKPKLGAVLPRGSRVDVVISRGGRS